MVLLQYGTLSDKITHYDEYMSIDEMARKRTSVYTAEAEDESGED